MQAPRYAHLPAPVDGLIWALGYARDRRAIPAILEKVEALDAAATHHHAAALALDRPGDPAAAPPLAQLPCKPGMFGHTLHRTSGLVNEPREKRQREDALRELKLARALLR